MADSEIIISILSGVSVIMITLAVRMNRMNAKINSLAAWTEIRDRKVEDTVEKVLKALTTPAKGTQVTLPLPAVLEAVKRLKVIEPKLLDAPPAPLPVGFEQRDLISIVDIIREQEASGAPDKVKRTRRPKAAEMADSLIDEE